MKVLLFIVTLIFVACSTPNKPVEVNTYQTAGVEEFLLTNIPSWLNFSKKANCMRSDVVQFLDFSKIHRAYNFSWQQMMDLQILFNQEKSKYANTEKGLTPKFETVLFFELVEKIKSGVRSQTLPKYPEYYVAWIDPYFQNKDRLSAFKEFIAIKSQELPVIMVSLCYSETETKKELEVLFPDESFIIFGYEASSVFGIDFTNEKEFKFYPEEYFGKEKKINWINTESEELKDVWINVTKEI